MSKVTVLAPSIFSILILALGFGRAGCAAGLPDSEIKPAEVSPTFRITYGYMCSPEAYFMLAWHDRQVLAIKFYEAKRDDQGGTGSARYIVYLPREGRTDFRAGVQTQEGTVSVTGWTGFHPFVFQRGRYKIKAGGFRLTYQGGTCLDFEGTPYEYAPTPWTKIEDVDAWAPYLRWFRDEPPSELSLEISPEELLPPS